MSPCDSTVILSESLGAMSGAQRRPAMFSVRQVDVNPVVVDCLDQVDEPEGVLSGGDRAAALGLTRDVVAEPIRARARCPGSGALSPVIDGVYNPGEVAAHHHLEEGSQLGKVVVTV